MTDQNHWPNAAWGTPGGQPAPIQAAPQPAPAAQAVPAPGAQPGTYGTGTAAPGPGWSASAYGAPPAPAAAPKRRGWIVGLAAVLSFFILGLFSIGSCTAVMTAPMGALSYDSPSWADTVTGDTVGIISIDGTIQYDGSTSSPEGLKAQLDAAEQNPHIKAVVLRVNSGGGVATAGEEMARYVRDFSKPVVVSCASLDASAAYMISSQADYIYTAETSAVGSIGVIMSVTDLSGLYEKLGISVDNITSADAKDAGGGDRPLTEEERAWYQAQVDQINDVFIATVAEGRSMTEDEVRALATGLTFTGIDAVGNGLADEIGTLEMAVEKAASLAGVADADTVYLQDSSSDLGRLLDIMGTEDEATVTDMLKELEDRVGLE
ncbi:signal peptide peptidase SppA [Adlercreutzia muris]|uniref:signal peptide peptidase SppA n=1 Tax=Adlercreutzia muris TaxID=1796610 RepID=UPI003516F655